MTAPASGQPRADVSGLFYGSVLRVRTTRNWPIGICAIGFEQSSPSELSGTATVVVYGTDEKERNKYPTLRYDDVGNADGVALMWRFPAGTPISGKVPPLRPAEPADVDIQLKISAKDLTPVTFEMLERLNFAIAAHLALTFDDVLTPTGPVHFLTDEFLYHVERPLPLTIFVPHPIDTQSITDALHRCVRHVGIDQPTQGAVTTFAVATKRFMQAQLQSDVVAAFTDYWIVCALLSKHLANDEKVAMTRYLLPSLSRPTAEFGDAIGEISEENLRKKLIEPLDTVRNEIFHGGDHTAIKDLDEHAGVLADVATTMLAIAAGHELVQFGQRASERMGWVKPLTKSSEGEVPK